MNAKDLLKKYFQNEQKADERLKADSAASRKAPFQADSALTQSDSANRIRELAGRLVRLEGSTGIQIERTLEEEFDRAGHRGDLVAARAWAGRIEAQLGKARNPVDGTNAPEPSGAIPLPGDPRDGELFPEVRT
jgi:hypothetical protein